MTRNAWLFCLLIKVSRERTLDHPRLRDMEAKEMSVWSHIHKKVRLRNVSVLQTNRLRPLLVWAGWRLCIQRWCKSGHWPVYCGFYVHHRNVITITHLCIWWPIPIQQYTMYKCLSWHSALKPIDLYLAIWRVSFHHSMSVWTSSLINWKVQLMGRQRFQWARSLAWSHWTSLER